MRTIVLNIIERSFYLSLDNTLKNIIKQVESRPFYGIVISETGVSLADVKISVLGGSQVYSNSSGEFMIYCKAGSFIKFEKYGYKLNEFILNDEQFKNYQKIRLKKY